MAGESNRPSASVPWVAVETLLATSLALYLSLRLEAPVVWLFLPLGLLVAGRQPLSAYGLDLRFRPPSLAVHAGIGVTLLALYTGLHTWIAARVLHQAFALALPANPAADFVREFLVVAFPEEVFFRGYVQTRWNRACGRPWRLCGAAVGPGLLVQAAIFGVCHLATGDWTRLRVIFFALLAGWLRERSGSVLAPAVYHAVANVWYRMLLASFH
jgi:membrane protease YdiL (CAAX protease family)